MKTLREVGLLRFFKIQVLTIYCLVHLIDSLNLTSTNGHTDFEVGSQATFTCTILPYTGTLNWYYGATHVAGCTGFSCTDIDNDQGAFQFQYDTTSFVFTWNIPSVQIKYNEKTFTCNDGTNNQSTIITVNVIQSIDTVKGSGISVSASIAIIAVNVGISVCAIDVVIIYMRNRRINAPDAPRTPVGLELVRDSVTEVSADFRCRPAYQPGRQEIVLFCQQANNGNHQAENAQIIDEAGAIDITLRINNLRQGCVYDCSVFARSTNMKSGHSEKIRIRTLERSYMSCVQETVGFILIIVI